MSQTVVHFAVAPVWSSHKALQVEAFVLPKVTGELPVYPVPFHQEWGHLSGIRLADPDFGCPGNVDVLLGADVFSSVILHGRRCGPPNSPTAFETCFGWALSGAVQCGQLQGLFASHHVSALSVDDTLRKFWEVEEPAFKCPNFSPAELDVVEHFHNNHYRDQDGRFVVPLPMKPSTGPIGESRSSATRRFLSLERSLRAKGQFQRFSEVIEEYFVMKHAEPVPTADLNKPRDQVFYLPMQAVLKESSSTTKVRAVFDASAKSSSGVSLNDKLLVGPTVHPTLLDVLLRFRRHRVALTTDISRMYRAVVLPPDERDLHRFVWRKQNEDLLQDYRMTRVTFGVASSSFAANMAVKQNAIDHATEYPLASAVVHESFYVDDGLTGADSTHAAKELQQQLQSLFSRAGFLLRKWKSSDPSVVVDLPHHLQDPQLSHTISDPDGYTKTLGIEWSTSLDCFRLTIAELPSLKTRTKRSLISDIAKTFDVLGWFSPTIIKVKILLQRVWEAKIEWDDPVPEEIQDSWEKWRSELGVLSSKRIPRCYFPKDAHIVSMQLHGFSDASEVGVVYLRMVDTTHRIHVSLVLSKTKVAPIRRLTIPRLELCGAYLLAGLLHHVKDVLGIPSDSVFAWTDSMVVLGWLVGNPRRFKTFVGNRISEIMELVPPHHWRHVSGLDNPADSASRGLFPSELLNHTLWWHGPAWLCKSRSEWPVQQKLAASEPLETVEERELCLHASTTVQSTLPILDKFSSYTRLQRVTAWVLRFISNCRLHRSAGILRRGPLSVEELSHAENYWLLAAQTSGFAEEKGNLEQKRGLSTKSVLLQLRPFLDAHGLLRVGGRMNLSNLPHSRRHPVILPANHPLTKLIIRTEHLRLLHGRLTLVMASLNRRFHIVGLRRAVRSSTRGCITCRRTSAKPRPQLLGQLPTDRFAIGPVFARVGVDYAGPVLIKCGSVRKPTFLKAYISVFVSLSVKAVHLELVSDLTTGAFIAALRRFIARRGKPVVMWSDNGSNFVGAAREIKEFIDFLQQAKLQQIVSEFCSVQGIHWKFIPERTPHYGGLWEAAVKSMKIHLKRVLSNAKLTFEEFTTVLNQIEACLNSRPLIPLPNDEDGTEALTPGHFLIGAPLEALPDSLDSYQPAPLLRRWHLCQMLVRHFWQRWHEEYLICTRKFTKWRLPSRNPQEGDLVTLHEDGLVPAKWPMARILSVRPGKDGLVRVVKLKTPNGTYTRPVTKIALILPSELS